MTLSIVNYHASLPVAYRLYLPRERADDAARRKGTCPGRDQFQDQAADCAEQARAALLAGIARRGAD